MSEGGWALKIAKQMAATGKRVIYSTLYRDVLFTPDAPPKITGRKISGATLEYVVIDEAGEYKP